MDFKGLVGTVISQGYGIDGGIDPYILVAYGTMPQDFRKDELAGVLP